MGLISIINEECVRPSGNSSSFVYKAKMIHKDSNHLVSEKLHRPWEFGVKHFAGLVTYDATDFIERNTDQLPLDLLECVTKCTNSIISTQFDTLLTERQTLMQSTRRKQGAMSMTICSKFRKRLAGLIEHIAATKTRYVRCIKPNENKTPRVTDHMVTMRQLGSAGIVTAINISKNIFPNQLPYDTVWDRFHCLSKTNIDPQLDYIEKTTLLLSDVFKESERFVKGQYTAPYVCGKTKVFFRSGALKRLESDRSSIRSVNVSTLHNYAKTVVHRSRFRVMKRATVKLQAMWRLQKAQRDYKERMKAAVTIYYWMKHILARIKRKALRENDASIKIQSTWRAFNPRKKLKQQKKAAAMVQKSFKKRLDRKHFGIAFAECVDAARKQKQMKSLLHALSSDRNQDKDKLLDDCQIMISYLGDHLYAQRVKTAETKDELERSKQRVGSLQSRVDTLEAENKANRIVISRQQEKGLALEEKLKKQEDASSDLTKSIALLQKEQTSAIEKHEKERSDMQSLYKLKSEEVNKDLAVKGKEHAAEVSRLKDMIKLSKEKHQREISDLQMTLEEREEAHGKEYEKMLIVMCENMSKQEELESNNESLQEEIKSNQSEMQSSKQAFSEELTALKDKLGGLQVGMHSNDSTFESLQSQIKLIQLNHSIVTDEHEKEGSEIQDMSESQKNDICIEPYNARALHVKEVDSYEMELRSSEKAQSKGMSDLVKERNEMRDELMSKEKIIASQQSKIKSLQEEHTTAIAGHENERADMQKLMASHREELNIELSSMARMNVKEIENIKAELRSSKKAHLEDLNNFNATLEKLQNEMNDQKRGCVMCKLFAPLKCELNTDQLNTTTQPSLPPMSLV